MYAVSQNPGSTKEFRWRGVKGGERAAVPARDIKISTQFSKERGSCKVHAFLV